MLLKIVCWNAIELTWLWIFLEPVEVRYDNVNIGLLINYVTKFGVYSKRKLIGTVKRQRNFKIKIQCFEIKIENLKHRNWILKS